jgi:hypothetical protein
LVGAVALLAASAFWIGAGRSEAAARAPEADKVLDAQTSLPFQVLIPGYLPPGFDRKQAEMRVIQPGNGRRPAVQIRYQSREASAALFVSEWIPISPTLETLVGSRPIETKWGRGFLLTDSVSGHSTIWADVGLLRVAVDSTKGEPVSPEVALAILDSMGPAANQQVSSTIAEEPVIREAEPPPPVEIATNEQGIQELTLVATVAGYSPARFLVRKGIPVNLVFRALGDAACASELVFPANQTNPTELILDSPQDTKTLRFTPMQEGEFVFHCVHDIYKGVMVVE